MVGRTTLSGIQRKISLSLSATKTTLQLAIGRGRFILKPQSPAFPSVPENEHVTMRIAERAGIEVPPCALVRLSDGTFAYIVSRFDRPAAGGKLRQEDFCQLAERSPKDKYDGSAELCARLIRRHATEPLVEQLKLFRQMVFAWWTGNGDLHLKNLSLLTDLDGIHRLSPAYDLICTRLVIPEDNLALSVGGKKANLTLRTWLNYAEYCGIPERAASRILKKIVDTTGEAIGLIARSFLNQEMKEAYSALLQARSRALRQ